VKTEILTDGMLFVRLGGTSHGAAEKFQPDEGPRYSITKYWLFVLNVIEFQLVELDV